MTEPKRTKTTRMRLFFDGASKQNPGPSGAGWILLNEDDDALAFGWSYLGDSSTNNEAEYTALIRGLEHLVTQSEPCTVSIFGDSKLVVEHVKGGWKCKAANLKPLLGQVRGLQARLKELDHTVTFSHIGRDANTLADKLSNLAVEKKTTYVHDEIVPKKTMSIKYLNDFTPRSYTPRTPEIGAFDESVWYTSTPAELAADAKLTVLVRERLKQRREDAKTEGVDAKSEGIQRVRRILGEALSKWAKETERSDAMLF
jgi:ribonuclease HI